MRMIELQLQHSCHSRESGSPDSLWASIKAGLSARPHWIPARSEEHTSEHQSPMRISYAVFCLKKKISDTTPAPSSPYITPYTTLYTIHKQRFLPLDPTYYRIQHS